MYIIRETILRVFNLDSSLYWFYSVYVYRWHSSCSSFGRPMQTLRGLKKLFYIIYIYAVNKMLLLMHYEMQSRPPHSHFAALCLTRTCNSADQIQCSRLEGFPTYQRRKMRKKHEEQTPRRPVLM
jgi:hypothetical protein